jgi:hypothetical protein
MAAPWAEYPVNTAPRPAAVARQGSPTTLCAESNQRLYGSAVANPTPARCGPSPATGWAAQRSVLSLTNGSMAVKRGCPFRGPACQNPFAYHHSQGSFFCPTQTNVDPCPRLPANNFLRAIFRGFPAGHLPKLGVSSKPLWTPSPCCSLL